MPRENVKLKDGFVWGVGFGLAMLFMNGVFAVSKRVLLREKRGNK